ncbi:MAG: hypothetical protein QW728_02590 [Thermoplasmata archaeon]
MLIITFSIFYLLLNIYPPFHAPTAEARQFWVSNITTNGTLLRNQYDAYIRNFSAGYVSEITFWTEGANEGIGNGPKIDFYLMEFEDYENYTQTLSVRKYLDGSQRASNYVSLNLSFSSDRTIVFVVDYVDSGGENLTFPVVSYNLRIFASKPFENTSDDTNAKKTIWIIIAFVILVSGILLAVLYYNNATKRKQAEEEVGLYEREYLEGNRDGEDKDIVEDDLEFQGYASGSNSRALLTNKSSDKPPSAYSTKTPLKRKNQVVEEEGTERIAGSSGGILYPPGMFQSKVTVSSPEELEGEEPEKAVAKYREKRPKLLDEIDELIGESSPSDNDEEMHPRIAGTTLNTSKVSSSSQMPLPTEKGSAVSEESGDLKPKKKKKRKVETQEKRKIPEMQVSELESGNQKAKDEHARPKGFIPLSGPVQVASSDSGSGTVNKSLKMKSMVNGSGVSKDTRPALSKQKPVNDADDSKPRKIVCKCGARVWGKVRNCPQCGKKLERTE